MKIRDIALLAAVSVLATGCTGLQKIDSEHVIDIAEIGIPDETQPPTQPPPEPTSAHFLAVGDNLVHSCVYNTAAQHSPDGVDYDFHYCYEHVADKVAAADLAFVNQETIICNGKYDVSGTNLNFNSPVELGEDMIDVGFDIFNMANNHVLDKGSEGMEFTLDYWDEQMAEHSNVVVMGAYRNEEDMLNYRMTEVNDITVGFLGYTEHTNGYHLPENSDMVIVYTDEEELIQKQISELSEQVDCVVVSMHWGVEDSHVVTDEVRELAQKLVNWGADVVIGTGSHTLESMEYLTREDGSQGFVFYSLGNFISGQTDNFNMIGGMGEFEICKSAEGEITIEDVTLTPVITHYESGMTNVRTYPYYLYTDELVETHNVPYAPGGSSKRWNWDVINGIIHENVPEEFLLLTESPEETSETEEISQEDSDTSESED